MGERFRILSIDGGGVRGIAPARWLLQLHGALGLGERDPLGARFDLLAGTSTGGILALALACGIPAKKIVDLYKDRALAIFPPRGSRIWSRLQRLWRDGVSASKYSETGINQELKEVFGTWRMGDLHVLGRKAMVVTYNTFTRQPYIIKSWEKEFADLPVWEAARATSAAPTFFPAHVINIGSVMHPLIDGGVVANNPSACALAEAVRFARTDRAPFRFALFSLGTGRAAHPLVAHKALTMGALEWAPHIFDVLLDASEAVHYQMRQLVEGRDSVYARFQFPLPAQYEAMDDGQPEHIRELDALALQYVSNDAHDLFKTMVKETSS